MHRVWLKLRKNGNCTLFLSLKFIVLSSTNLVDQSLSQKVSLIDSTYSMFSIVENKTCVLHMWNAKYIY